MKRNEYIMPISREHHFTLLFSWKIRTGIRNGIAFNRIRDYISYFWDNILQHHLEQEERYLFTKHEDVLVQKAVAEHKQLKERVMGILREHVDDNALLLQLAEMVDNHTRFEERELFPHLEKILFNSELKEIGSHFEEKIKDEYADQFWTQAPPTVK